jgi:hypothetical protein
LFACIFLFIRGSNHGIHQSDPVFLLDLLADPRDCRFAFALFFLLPSDRIAFFLVVYNASLAVMKAVTVVTCRLSHTVAAQID